MPGFQKEQIVDYQLMTSRHFFPGKYIITKSISFGQTIDTSSTNNTRLIADQGPRMISNGAEIPTYNSVLSLPIIVDNVRDLNYTNRIWVDGLDFLNLIWGKNLTNIKNPATKIFGTTPYTTNASFNDYDSSAVTRLDFTIPQDSPATINVNFNSNVENVFQFVPYSSIYLNPILNGIIQEQRTAQRFDVSIGVLNNIRQSAFPILTTGAISTIFTIEQILIHGSGIPRYIFAYNNFRIEGNLTVIDDIRKYANSGILFEPNLQTYSVLNIDSNTGHSVDANFSINFPEIDQNATYKWSDFNYYNRVDRNISQGLLTSTSTILSPPYLRNN